MIIPRHAYTDEAVFEAELEKLFVSRLFIGTNQNFTNDDSYNSFQLGKYALTCRRDDDAIRAFNNVCLHRNTLIDPPGSGRRDFRCSYHGWRYGSCGELLQAPLTDGSCILNRKLVEYPVAACGGLNFVSLQGSAPDVREVDGLLQRHALAFDEPPFCEDQLEHDCNWKLLVENVLEGYHLSFVHGKTFGSAGFNSQAKADAGQGSYTLWSRAIPDDAKELAALRYLSGTRPQYLHGFVFPGTFVANTNNLIGFVSHLLPLAVNKTRLSWQLFELPALRRLPANVREQIKQDAVRTAKKILLEDKPVVELCQQGLSAHGPDMQWQPQEQQITHFHAMYARNMNEQKT